MNKQTFRKMKKKLSIINQKILIMIFLINCDLIIFNIKKIKIGLCCLAKQENKYIKEYVDYYLKLGFHKIIWFDNNNIDREIFKKIH